MNERHKKTCEKTQQQALSDMEGKTLTPSNELYRWDFGLCDTAYFYFYANESKDFLFCIEYWLDEDTTAGLSQVFTIDGKLLEDCEEEYDYPCEVDLTDEQKSAYTKQCKDILDSNADETI